MTAFSAILEKDFQNPKRAGVDIRAEKEKFYVKLAEKGLKATTQRADILDTFLRSKEHLGIEGLLAIVRRKNPRIGYATVYRTLKLLTECGIACERDFGDGQTRYEHTTGDGHHDHLICLECGGIVEFENEKIEALQDEVASRHGFQVIHHKLELYGYCTKCGDKRKKKR